jgi:DNA polymerase I-like protein with 3'-5' exonuclease and polymerase domains
VPFIEIEGELPTGLDSYTTYQVYNCLDSAVTAELLPAMLDNLNENHHCTYLRGMRVLALCLEMSTKGFPIDTVPLAELLWQLEKDEKLALRRLHQFCEAIDARPINPRSTTDVPWLFYEHLGLPAIYQFDRKTKTRKVTSDIKALEKLRVQYPIAVPLVNAILAVREASKMASVFKRGLEPGRPTLRCSFSPSGTETGRLSSQSNPYGRGTNAQNLTDRVRQAIGAPDGYAILNLDLKTAESIAVGYLSGGGAYLKACQSGDLHTAVTRMTWPDKPWTGELKKDKQIAEQPGYRHFSWRDLAKREGHATNYYATPRGISHEVRIPLALVEEFQRGYLSAFPEIAEWHLDTIARIQRDGILVTPLRRERRFWGRPDDPATHREAIAYVPQSLIGDVMNEGLIQVQSWLLRECRDAKPFLGRGNKLLRFDPNTVDLRAQVHDAGVFLIPIEALDTLAPMIQKKLEFPVDFGPLGSMVIPSDLMVGKRWCKAPKDKNGRYIESGYMAAGLRDWTPGQALHWL